MYESHDTILQIVGVENAKRIIGLRCLARDGQRIRDCYERPRVFGIGNQPPRGHLIRGEFPRFADSPADQTHDGVESNGQVNDLGHQIEQVIVPRNVRHLVAEGGGKLVPIGPLEESFWQHDRGAARAERQGTSDLG